MKNIIIEDTYEFEFEEDVSDEEAKGLTDEIVSILKRKETKDSALTTEEKESPKAKLIYPDGTEVKKGDEVTSFRGEKAIVSGWEVPAHEGKAGKVYVHWIREGKEDESELGYYVTVFDLSWKDLPWQKEEKVEDTEVKDIPVNSPEEEVTITHTEKLPKGKSALTYGMIETAFKDRGKDDGRTFKAYIDAAIESLKEDIKNAEFIVSGEMKPTRKLLLEDYVKIEHLVQKAGLEDKLAEMKPLVDELSEKLDLNYWKQPKFKKATQKQVSKELRSKHRWDSKITKVMKPVFLCTKSDLTASYNDAKQGKLPEVFRANLEKVRKDMAADYDRIMQGRDTYVEDPRIRETLPEIIDLYETALEYANELAYTEYGEEFVKMLETIKKHWGLAGE